MGLWSQKAVPLSAVDTKCHKCGGIGHYASERPSKGTGSGKDNGGKKGGSKYGGENSGGKRGGKPYGGKLGGKGLGKDGKGSAGFKGKGQGPAEGCWTCGGARFSYQCPQNGGDKGQQKGGIRSLCGLQTAPMDSDLFSVFRRVGTTYVANISRAVSGKESFYPIVSKVSEIPVKGKMGGKMCWNRFERLGEEVDGFVVENPS